MGFLNFLNFSLVFSEVALSAAAGSYTPLTVFLKLTLACSCTASGISDAWHSERPIISAPKYRAMVWNECQLCTRAGCRLQRCSCTWPVLALKLSKLLHGVRLCHLVAVECKGADANACRRIFWDAKKLLGLCW